MSLKEFRKLIRKYIEEELNEASVTANIDGGEGPPKTPYAFRKKKDEEDESGFQDGHINPETGTTYEKVKKHEHNYQFTNRWKIIIRSLFTHPLNSEN